MNKEKIVLSVVAILLGLFVAGGAFYIYQMTKTIDEPQSVTPTPSIMPTQTTKTNNLLTLDEPKDEQVFGKRIINIKGKTMPDATIIISSSDIDEVVTPSKNGDFAATHTIAEGTSILKITSIFKDGSETSVYRTVSNTSEDF